MRRSGRPRASSNGARAQLEQATRDVERYTALVAKNATTLVTLNNAKTQVNIFTAAVESNTAQLELLRVQRDYTFIRAPITGRVSMANVKVGNYARQADPIPLATIIQVAPVYVTFALPQRSLPELRQAITNETATIQAIVPGDSRHATGQVTMIENTVDAATGTVPVRATMPNTDELLWPGTLVQVRLTVPRGGGGGSAVGRHPGQPVRAVRLRGQERRRDGDAGQGRAGAGSRNGARERA